MRYKKTLSRKYDKNLSTPHTLQVQQGPSKYGPFFSDWLQVRMRVTFTDTIWNETQITEAKRIEFLKRGCL